MGLLEAGAAWLADQLQESLSVPVEYICRGGEGVPVKATIGRTLFRAEDQYGITTRVESRDFLILADDLPVTPARGDVIIFDGCRYEVLAPNGEPVWRWSGTENLVRRIHTKNTEVKNA